MVHRNNSLNEIYKQYDGELNALHSFDAVHPLMSVASSSHVGVSNQLKTSKEELENGLLLVGHSNLLRIFDPSSDTLILGSCSPVLTNLYLGSGRCI